METVRLALNAMNTRFELVLHGDNPASLQAAGEEALAEVERIENHLSLFRPTSEIAHLNARAAQEPVRVSPEVFTLLNHARRLSEETQGAFDITAAPLLRCWGLLGRKDGNVPGAQELAAARCVIGMRLVEMDRANFTVRFAKPGVMLDLGAIGKGYAVEQAAEILREAGVPRALIHGGTSTIYALGAPPDADAWKVAIEMSELTNPKVGRVTPCAPGLDASAGGAHGVTRPTIALRDESLSISAVSGKCFQAAGRTFGHVIDPRSGEPASHALLAAVVLPSGTETDALSTALLVVGANGHDAIASLRPGMRTLLASQANDGSIKAVARNIELRAGKVVS